MWQRVRLYISGPISAGGTLPIWEQKEHVRFATEVAFSLIRKGFSVLCPHWSLLGEEHVHDRLRHDEWLANDFPWVEVCDAVYRIPGDSKGADAEVKHAESLKIPVFRDFISVTQYFAALGRIP
jgi:hypothetical protein